MTQEELYLVLAGTGIPVKYLQFESEAPIPCMVYIEEGRSNVLADDRVWHKFKSYRIELYTLKKSPETELILENALDESEIIYEMDDIGFIHSEELHEVVYYITI